MLDYGRIDVSEGIDVKKKNDGSRTYITCNYHYFFKINMRFQSCPWWLSWFSAKDCKRLNIKINSSIFCKWCRYSEKKIHNSGTTLLKNLNEEINIIKIVKTLENSGILLKSVTSRIEIEAKRQKGGSLTYKYFIVFYRYFTCYFIRKFVKWKRCH